MDMNIIMNSNMLEQSEMYAKCNKSIELYWFSNT